MTAAVYVVGPPAVGKTTLVDRLLAGYARGEPERLGYGPLIGEPLHERGCESPDADGLHLGKSRPAFGGTDALGMVILHDAVRWATEAPLPPLVVGEGARLTHPLFLTALAQRARLVVIHLWAPPSLLDERVAARGSVQNEPWRRGQATRVHNAVRAAAEAGVHVHRVIATRDAAAIEAHARSALGARGIDLAPPP